MMQRQRMKQRQPMPENRQAMCLWLRQVSTLMHQRRDLRGMLVIQLQLFASCKPSQALEWYTEPLAYTIAY